MKIKFITVLIQALLCCAPFYSVAQWREAGKFGTGYVRSLFLASDGTLYASGEESLYRLTANNTAWEKIKLPKPFTINCFIEYGGAILIGTENNGIYRYENGKFDQITKDAFEDKLEGESLSVSTIVAASSTLLANVYHYGNPAHGGSHSRIYASRDGGLKWVQETEFNVHNTIFSFTKAGGGNVLAATLKGVFYADITASKLQWVSSAWDQSKLAAPFTKQDTIVVRKIVSIDGSVLIGIPDYEYYLKKTASINCYDKLFRSDNNGVSWYPITIPGLVGYGVTDLFWDNARRKLYATGYYGIFSAPLQNLSTNWTPEYSGSSFLYTTNILVDELDNRFVTEARGMRKSARGTTTWNPINTNLKINYVYATYVDNEYVLAVTENGLHYSTPDQVAKNADWRPVADGLTSEGRFTETTKASLAPVKLPNGKTEVYVATNNGIVKFSDINTAPVRFPSLPYEYNPAFRSPVYYQEEIQSLLYAGDNFYAVAYETPFVFDKATNTWKKVFDGLKTFEGVPVDPSRNSVSMKGIQESNGEVYLLMEDYSNAPRGGHDVWTYPKNSQVYRFKPAEKKWEFVKGLDEKAKIQSFTASGGNLIISAQREGGTTLINALNVNPTSGAPAWQPLSNPLKSDDGSVRNIFSAGNNLFLTATNNTSVFASADGGKTWSTSRQNPESTVASLAASSSVVYAGLTDDGMALRPLNEFFEVEIDSIVKPDFAPADQATGKVTDATAPEVKLILRQFPVGTTAALVSRSITSAADKWTTTPLVQTGNTFAAKLPASQFDNLGSAYYVTVTRPPQYRNPDPAKAVQIVTDTVKVAVQYPEGMTFDNELRFGKAQNSYNFISMPLLLKEKKSELVLKEVLANKTAQNVTQWRLFTYTGQSGRGNFPTEGGVWLQYPTEFEIGRGYLLAIAAASSVKKIKTGLGQTVANGLEYDAASKRYFYKISIPAKSNWFPIGNPYLYDVDWNDVKSFNNNPDWLETLISFENNGAVRKAGDRLLKFSGGYVKIKGDEAHELRIPVPLIKSGRRSSEKKEESPDLAVQFHLQSGTQTDQLSGLGIQTNASEGLDLFDLTVPPSLGDFPTLRFSSKGPEPLTRSILPPTGQGQVWEFTVLDVEEGQAVDLSWQIQSKAGRQLWLHDVTSEKKVDMLTLSGYSFRGKKQFKVYYGTEQFISEQLYPEKNLVQAYPNPFVHKTTLRFTLPQSSSPYRVRLDLFDVQGRKIKTVVEGEYRSGFHPVEVPLGVLSSGTYLVKATFNGETLHTVQHLKLVRQ